MSTAEPTDEDLAALVGQRGTPAALQAAQDACRELYRRHSQALLGFLRRRIGAADCEDLLNEVWAKIWELIATRFHGGRFRDWMFQIARNLVIDTVRRRRSQPLESAPEPMMAHTPYHDLFAQDRQRVLEGCIQQLTERASALVRGRLAGDSYETLCQRLELTAAQAHKLWHTALGQLTSCVQRGLQ